jgi:alkanesulfonate monooxygenase SsuD/methylene tetrahydromethanopterin reductase-like flavin-dependent oxidoreductase (luciferase family)
LPGASVVLGDTPSEAEERAAWIRDQQVTGPRAIAFLEQFWGKDLSGYDPDGPLPDIEPAEGELDPSRGTLPIAWRTGKRERIEGWRQLAAERGLSLRRLVVEVTPRHDPFVGTPGQIAEQWGRYLRSGAVDGFNILPERLPGTVEDIVGKLVPELQERGLYRTAYEGTTLREHLELA